MWRQYLLHFKRPTKQLIIVATDLLGFSLTGVGVGWLLLGSVAVEKSGLIFLITSVLVSIPIAWLLGLYRSVVRFIGLDLLAAGALTAISAAVLGSAVLYSTGSITDPVRWAVAYCAIAFIYICASRYFARLFLSHHSGESGQDRVIIYGAGDAGAQLLTTLAEGGEYSPVALIDDDPTLHGKTVKGRTVYPPAVLKELTQSTGATRILLAMPSASRRRRRQVLELVTELPVRVQTIPDMMSIVAGEAKVDDIRDVDVKELLGRNIVPPNPELMGESIANKNVLVTGAGGSIGSELCRQILRQEPSRLVLFELSEVALYTIEHELLELRDSMQITCEIVSLLGSIRHESRLRKSMEVFRIHTVFHAAAYKHVPIVEQNVLQGIQNNVFGTLYAARAAIDAGVENFVLISTDKAVNPTSVMGASKRMAEMVLQAMGHQSIEMKACMVRFGNVLESSGSVVPLFRKQIRSGGPVTVTHRDIIRYFMTIPEAAQLVIQAAALARGGDVFVLDMGQPVRISDLAKRMINLMGMSVQSEENPEGDIEIKYTGLRPAEKLYEELLIGSNVYGTDHPRILRASEDFLPQDELATWLDELRTAIEAMDCNRAREVLRLAVKEYKPENGIDDLVWVEGNAVQTTTDTIVDFPSKHA